MRVTNQKKRKVRTRGPAAAVDAVVVAAQQIAVVPVRFVVVDVASELTVHAHFDFAAVVFLSVQMNIERIGTVYLMAWTHRSEAGTDWVYSDQVAQVAFSHWKQGWTEVRYYDGWTEV